MNTLILAKRIIALLCIGIAVSFIRVSITSISPVAKDMFNTFYYMFTMAYIMYKLARWIVPEPEDN
jgi:hypothetical protein